MWEDLELADKYGMNCVHFACGRGHMNVMNVIIKMVLGMNVNMSICQYVISYSSFDLILFFVFLFFSSPFLFHILSIYLLHNFIHTYIHTYVHTHTHIHISTYTHTYIYISESFLRGINAICMFASLPLERSEELGTSASHRINWIFGVISIFTSFFSSNGTSYP